MSAALPHQQQLLTATELLETAVDLSEAVYMACGDIEDDRGRGAIKAVTDLLGKQIREALAMVKKAREEIQ